jgi:hypothetical protein
MLRHFPAATLSGPLPGVQTLANRCSGCATGLVFCGITRIPNKNARGQKEKDANGSQRTNRMQARRTPSKVLHELPAPQIESIP